MISYEIKTTCEYSNIMRYTLQMLSKIGRKRIRKILYSKVMLIVLVLMLAIFVRGTWSVRNKSILAGDNQEQAIKELQSLQAREHFLKEEIVELDSDRGQEAQLRERFDVGKEGEKLIVLVDTTMQVKEIAEPKKSIWQKIKDIF